MLKRHAFSFGLQDNPPEGARTISGKAPPLTHQRPRRDQSGKRSDPDDRSRNDRRDIDDSAAGSAGSVAPLMACIDVFLDNPRYRQAKLASASWRAQAGERMAVAARMPHQAACPADRLPASEPNRAAVGCDAQERHAQQRPPNMRAVRRTHPGFPARSGSQQIGRMVRPGHRHFPYNVTQGSSPPQGIKVYHQGGTPSLKTPWEGRMADWNFARSVVSMRLLAELGV